MAEIKSTLDLIMEKTKNLTLTEEEKKAIHTKEVKSRVRGWFQRYGDGSLTIRDLKEYMEKERATFPEAEPLLREECLAHVDPEADNQKIFQMMDEVLGIDYAPFQLLVDDFNNETLRHRTEEARNALDILHVQGISGTSVTPNLNLSPAWKAFLDNARGQFQSKLYLVR
ncbi:MAG TPA: hypothetical protein DCG53_04910 [Syntrophus sp. (in: bacteria)]|nr:hypothetical protein [Syntrophus sp. (in: bacteria)]